MHYRPLYSIFIFFCVFAQTTLASNNSKSAERIAVAGGSITEIIYRLGEQQRIVGVDSTSQFPSTAKLHPLLGYVRNVSAEGVLSLNPDLLIGEPDAGPPKVISQIKNSGVETVIIKDDRSIAAINDKVLLVASLLGVEHKGQQLISDIKIDIDALRYAQKNLSTSPRILFLLSAANGSPIGAGGNTSADSVITEVGGINVLAELKGWQKLSPESAASINPDVIVVMNRDDNVLAELKKLPHFKFTNAVKNNAVVAIDGNYLLGFGPRTPQAIIELGTMIHSDFPLPKSYQFRQPNNAGHNTAGH